jgi:hypothetical protein
MMIPSVFALVSAEEIPNDFGASATKQLIDHQGSLNDFSTLSTVAPRAPPNPRSERRVGLSPVFEGPKSDPNGSTPPGVRFVSADEVLFN